MAENRFERYQRKSFTVRRLRLVLCCLHRAGADRAFLQELADGGGETGSGGAPFRADELAELIDMCNARLARQDQ